MPVEPGAPVQRLRMTFAVGGPARYASHLDLTRAWVRALRRLEAPVAYTRGFNPRARLSIAAPLPVSFAAEREMVDVLFDVPVDPRELVLRLRRELPAGLSLLEVADVPLGAPPLPSQVRAADYVVSFLEPPPADLAARLAALLEAESLPFTRLRQGKEIRFDLRPRILEARVEERQGAAVLALRLAHGPGGAARPEDVLQALGLPVESARATRTGLVLAER